MAMAVDTRQQPQMSRMGYGAMRYPAPQFTNPWASTSNGPSGQLYQTSMATTSAPMEQTSRPANLTIPYAGLQHSMPTSAGMNGFHDPQTSQSMSQVLVDTSRSYPSTQYTASPSPNSYAPTSAPQFSIDAKYAMDVNNSRSPFPAYQQDAGRRSSQPSVPSTAFLGSQPDVQKQRQSSLVDFTRMNEAKHFNSDVLDASRGMVAMSQDLTPRNIYGDQGRNSTDSYGFPSTHSAHSSISSASTYPSYYNGSVADSSATDYSSASESVDNNPRTLPRPQALVGTSLPPAPQSMMGQFSSKVSSSSQKKHKCKICDKRFTRPSSLQTHMYSHTGEKPFACEVEGCGRHFSVVSNLRRHRKVHQSQHERDHPSPEDE